MKYLEEENEAMRKKLGTNGKRSAASADDSSSDNDDSSSDSVTVSLGTSSDEDVDEYIDLGRFAVPK